MKILQRDPEHLKHQDQAPIFNGPCLVCGRSSEKGHFVHVFVKDDEEVIVTEVEAEALSPRDDLGFQCLCPACLQASPDLRSYVNGGWRLVTETPKVRANRAPSLSRETAIRRIRDGLRARSGKSWSVDVRRGTAWGGIRVAPPRSRYVDGKATPEDCRELFRLLGLGEAPEDGRVYDHVLVPQEQAFYIEYVDRAEGRTPTVRGAPDWE